MRRLLGLAYDVATGTVLLVSDESSALVEARIDEAPTVDRARAARLSLVRERTLVDEDDEPLERVEGVVVDESGRTWVLLEDDCALCRLVV